MSPTLTPESLEALMDEALIEARRGAAMGEVPVGAVVQYQGKIIARAHNLVESNKDASAHAEVLALKQAAAHLGDWRLTDAVLCVTLEPCSMCIASSKLHRVGAVVFGVHDERMGACGSIFDLAADTRLGPVPRVISGIREQECLELLQEFFQNVRAKRGASNSSGEKGRV